MSYCTAQLVQDEIGGANKLTQALDDADTGKLDTALLQRLMDSASGAVDGFLQGRYIVPLNPVPALAVEASLIFTLEKIYSRRRQANDETNPYADRATEMRVRLKKIADREESLDAQERPAFAPGALIQRDSALQGSSL